MATGTANPERADVRSVCHPVGARRREARSAGLGICGLFLASIVCSGCGESFGSDDATTSSSGSGGAGSGGSAGEGGQGGSGGGTPPACIPSEASDAVSTECGVFVSSMLGDDGNDGAPTKPFATIKKALETAGAKRIYVCSESAPLGEDVLVERAVEIYGGLDCTMGWIHDAAKPTRIATAAGLIPMRVKGVAGAVRIEDFDLSAADAVDEGGSSVGMFVASATQVDMRRMSVVAGAGRDGADGELQPFGFPAKIDLHGNDAIDSNPDLGGDPKVCTCPAGDTTTGGKGGNQTAMGQDGGEGLPDYGGGAGGTYGAGCGVSGIGQVGGAAPSGGLAGMGAQMLGTIGAGYGWEPKAGLPGDPGNAGQGGGGGASPIISAAYTGAGGGGGCGGCGGAGGPGGQGGGASIALLVVAAQVTIDGGRLVAAFAGRGGRGSLGQQGQTEIQGSPGSGSDDGCQGGKGGMGSAGGPGGGGAGGVSAAVVTQGPAPAVTGTELVFDDLAAPGGVGAGTDNHGVEGKSQATLEIGG